jgi:hypothetical protein
LRILILGDAKSGTTGLYNSIKGALRASGEDWVFLFEPTAPEPFDALARYGSDLPLLTKVIVNKERACRLRHGDFSHRILVVRDPRDVVVSRLLFRPLVRGSVRNTPEATLEQFLAALRTKERDPSSWSVHGLHELANDLGITPAHWNGYVANLRHMMALDDRFDFHKQRYESFVDGDLTALSAYLGRDIVGSEAGRGSWLSHITRSKGYGDWRSWFREDDVDFFRPMFSRFMERYGYDDDWKLAPEPQIDPSTSSGHIEAKLVERRAQVEQRYSDDWSLDGVHEPEQVDALVSMATDGDAIAAHRVAALLREGRVGEADPAAALHWAERSAMLGSAEGMRLLARFHAEGVGTVPDAEQAEFWEGEAQGWATSVGRAAAGREVREMRLRMAAVERSSEYRVGDAFVRAVREPGRATLALPSRLWQIYARRPRRVRSRRRS